MWIIIFQIHLWDLENWKVLSDSWLPNRSSFKDNLTRRDELIRNHYVLVMVYNFLACFCLEKAMSNYYWTTKCEYKSVSETININRSAAPKLLLHSKMAQVVHANSEMYSNCHLFSHQNKPRINKLSKI